MYLLLTLSLALTLTPDSTEIGSDSAVTYELRSAEPRAPVFDGPWSAWTPPLGRRLRPFELDTLRIIPPDRRRRPRQRQGNAWSEERAREAASIDPGILWYPGPNRDPMMHIVPAPGIDPKMIVPPPRPLPRKPQRPE